jgi:Ras-related protein Rab-1A
LPRATLLIPKSKNEWEPRKEQGEKGKGKKEKERAARGVRVMAADSSGGVLESSAAFDYFFKILLIGDSDVGKTCLILRYADDCWTDTHVSATGHTIHAHTLLLHAPCGQIATIGVDFKLKTIRCDDTVVRLQIWDTAGQDRFRSLTESYYRNAHAVVLVYSITDMPSFQSVQRWLDEVNKVAGSGVVKLLLGNKADLTDKRVVPTEQAQELAASLDIPFFETSAKSSFNVEAAFTGIARRVKEKAGPPSRVRGPSISIPKPIHSKRRWRWHCDIL